jgi:hypothetical protein
MHVTTESEIVKRLKGCNFYTLYFNPLLNNVTNMSLKMPLYMKTNFFKVDYQVKFLILEKIVKHKQI